ncbi:MAG: class I SAM-dependent methyltransferase [Planctomycetes bacterium]|nr:class I SAM-dependent methyltransferase [Planctomycetota bacterium]
MLPRVLEPEVMDTAAEARDYDAMDHAAVNRVFVADLLKAAPALSAASVVGDRSARFDANHERSDAADAADHWDVLDLGTGTAQIPIELCRHTRGVRVLGVELASQMLQLAAENIPRAGFADRIGLRRADAKALPFPDGSFAVVMSNSIVHHIPEPRQMLGETLRVLKMGGTLFVCDLLRPGDDAAVHRLVQTYAGDANPHQQAMFGASLRAALTLEETREMVQELGFLAQTVQQTSDRHWTWTCRKPSSGT